MPFSNLCCLLNVLLTFKVGDILSVFWFVGEHDVLGRNVSSSSEEEKQPFANDFEALFVSHARSVRSHRRVVSL